MLLRDTTVLLCGFGLNYFRQLNWAKAINIVSKMSLNVNFLFIELLLYKISVTLKLCWYLGKLGYVMLLTCIIYYKYIFPTIVCIYSFLWITLCVQLHSFVLISAGVSFSLRQPHDTTSIYYQSLFSVVYVIIIYTECNKIRIILAQKYLVTKFQCFASYFCYWRFNQSPCPVRQGKSSLTCL